MRNRNRVRQSPELCLFLLSSFPHFLRNSDSVSWTRIGRLFRSHSLSVVPRNGFQRVSKNGEHTAMSAPLSPMVGNPWSLGSAESSGTLLPLLRGRERPNPRGRAAAQQPTIILSIYGGLVQDVFCSDPDTRVVFVDWGQEGERVGSPGVVEIEGDGRQHAIAVFAFEGAKLSDLPGTDVEESLIAAQRHGQLDDPVIKS